MKHFTATSQTGIWTKIWKSAAHCNTNCSTGEPFLREREMRETEEGGGCSTVKWNGSYLDDQLALNRSTFDPELVARKTPPITAAIVFPPGSTWSNQSGRIRIISLHRVTPPQSGSANHCLIWDRSIGGFRFFNCVYAVIANHHLTKRNIWRHFLSLFWGPSDEFSFHFRFDGDCRSRWQALIS